MSTITKERVKDILNFGAGRIISPITDDEIRDLARIALASLEAEPVAYMTYKGYLLHAADPKLAEYSEPTPLYAAPPAPVSVPYLLEQFAEFMAAESIKSGDYPDGWQCKASNAAHEYAQNIRAAMLHGADGNPSVIQDDVRRMDWLVSKTVDVREPMVYGSHSIFWSQTTTDEEDDYHATKLREQIDAAMAAENAAAPQQEVKK